LVAGLAGVVPVLGGTSVSARHGRFLADDLWSDQARRAPARTSSRKPRNPTVVGFQRESSVLRLVT